MTDLQNDSRRYVAMWSGPRTISTAMMRSFGNRADTFVCDEPLYAHYLLEHGFDHPGRDQILEHHDADVDRVIDWLTGDIPEGRSVFYQKHMSHHLVDDVPRHWLSRVTNVFLIREPREMLTSLMKVLEQPTLLDTGLPQQTEIFQLVRQTADIATLPTVIDARDVLENPRRLLGLLCDAVGVEFDERMLAWPAGRRETDGIWAPHWYGAVEGSTGFQPYRRKAVEVPSELAGVLGEAEPLYRQLYQNRLR